jgi:hypothetical protein
VDQGGADAASPERAEDLQVRERRHAWEVPADRRLGAATSVGRSAPDSGRISIASS